MLCWGLVAFWVRVRFRQFSSRQMRISAFYLCPIMSSGSWLFLGTRNIESMEECVDCRKFTISVKKSLRY